MFDDSLFEHAAFNVRQLQDQVCLRKHTQSVDKQRKLSKTLHLHPYEQYNMNLYIIYTFCLVDLPTQKCTSINTTSCHYYFGFVPCVQEMQRSRFGQVIKSPLSIDLPLPGTISGESASIVHCIHICSLFSCCVVMC